MTLIFTGRACVIVVIISRVVDSCSSDVTLLVRGLGRTIGASCWPLDRSGFAPATPSQVHEHLMQNIPCC
jgi:hypothetical protein